MNRPDNSPFPDAGEENGEQDEAGSQAQDVADEARARSTDLAEDSERGGRPNPAQILPDDTPDLVERLEEMNRSGRIDNDAFAGEPQMDDEEDILGPTEDED
jgi:hypothetical protein